MKVHFYSFLIMPWTFSFTFHAVIVLIEFKWGDPNFRGLKGLNQRIIPQVVYVHHEEIKSDIVSRGHEFP